MAYITDGSVQWDHVTSHHVEAKLFDGSLDRVFVLWTQDKSLGSFSRTTRDPLRLRFLGLKVSQDTFLQDGAGVSMCVGSECHILLLDHLLLVGLLVGVLRLVGPSWRQLPDSKRWPKNCVQQPNHLPDMLADKSHATKTFMCQDYWLYIKKDNISAPWEGGQNVSISPPRLAAV